MKIISCEPNKKTTWAYETFKMRAVLELYFHTWARSSFTDISFQLGHNWIARGGSTTWPPRSRTSSRHVPHHVPLFNTSYMCFLYQTILKRRRFRCREP